MSFTIPYMGNKRRLSDELARVISDLDAGPFLDLFSGMCSVAQAIGPSRIIWCNDIQAFPHLVARVLFTCAESPRHEDAPLLEKFYLRNLVALWQRYEDGVFAEARSFRNGPFDLKKKSFDIPYIGNSEQLARERQRLSLHRKEFPYRLFSITYAGSYFGLFQCMQIDSLRYAIDAARDKRSISASQKACYLVALGLALLRTSNSTGHFAQYLKPTSNNKGRIIEQRAKSVWSEFMAAVSSCAPVGKESWRKNNRCYKADSLLLLKRLESSDSAPAVIYADPPYSVAQYSRYYHLLDTLLQYKYPKTESVGRYPPSRYQTPFSHKRRVASAMETLISGSAQLRSQLVLSYPINGVFSAVGGSLLDLLKRHYKQVDIIMERKQSHSSFGGPKAAPRTDVAEQLYVARAPI